MSNYAFEIQQLYLQAQSAPTRMIVRGETMLTAWGLYMFGKSMHLLGNRIRNRRISPADAAEAFGLTLSLKEIPEGESIWTELDAVRLRLSKLPNDLVGEVESQLARQDIAKCEGRLQELLGDAVVMMSESTIKVDRLADRAKSFHGRRCGDIN